LTRPLPHYLLIYYPATHDIKQASYSSDGVKKLTLTDPPSGEISSPLESKKKKVGNMMHDLMVLLLASNEAPRPLVKLGFLFFG
jgi:hypothetical protein